MSHQTTGDVTSMPDAAWVVAIPGWHPTKLNDMLGGHWAKGHRLKGFDAQIVGLCVRGAGVPRAGCRREVTLEIVLGPRMRGGDPDCYWKSLLDALVLCGALKGDSKEHVVCHPVRYSRARRKATVITLWDSGNERQTQYVPKGGTSRPRRSRLPREDAA